MPGAPNRPPEGPAPLPPPPSPGETPELRLRRRLAPSRIALRLDVWKGAAPRELVETLAKAERLYGSGDLVGAESALDQLSVRFAEPRWPTLPTPFRSLRVEIPPPVPPHWDPEHSLPAPEKEARKARRHAEVQLALAKGSVDWAQAHSVAVDDLASAAGRAGAALEAGGSAETFWPEIDAIWAALRDRVPMPSPPPGRAAPPGPAATTDASAGES